MFAVSTNKNKNMLHFFAKSMISVSTNKNKNILLFYFKSEPRRKSI